ncbi:MAG TPA: hypothetical protein VK963_03210 [Candidatus Saccharimonadales bacterium]|nr:hypothetical protein [Candidatus Saccharimonadales bacterium]
MKPTGRDGKNQPAGKDHPAAADRLTVKIFSPFQTFYQGEAVSLSGVNQTGPFDILYNHANFFSLLTACEVTLDTGFQKLKFSINHGIITVAGNRLTLFVGV